VTYKGQGRDPNMFGPIITGCAVAQHCYNDGQQSQRKNGEFDPSIYETPKNFITKIEHMYCVTWGKTPAKFLGIGPVVSAPQIAEI